MGSGSDSIGYAMLASQVLQGLNGQGAGKGTPPIPPSILGSMGGQAGPLFNKAGQSNNVGLESLIQDILMKKMAGEMGPGGTPSLIRGANAGTQGYGLGGIG